METEELVIQTKKCSNPECGLVKPVSEFGKNKSKYDGLCTYCKICNTKLNKKYRKSYVESKRQKDKLYYEINKESILEYHKKYYKENREAITIINKIYIKSHPEIKSKCSKNYYNTHKGLIAKKQKKYVENNRDSINARQIRYRAENIEKVRSWKKQWIKNNYEKWILEKRQCEYRNRLLLGDRYMRHKLKMNLNFSTNDIKQHPELIKIQRNLTKIQTLCKTLQN